MVLETVSHPQKKPSGQTFNKKDFLDICHSKAPHIWAQLFSHCAGAARSAKAGERICSSILFVLACGRSNGAVCYVLDFLNLYSTKFQRNIEQVAGNAKKNRKRQTEKRSQRHAARVQTEARVYANNKNWRFVSNIRRKHSVSSAHFGVARDARGGVKCIERKVAGSSCFEIQIS